MIFDMKRFILIAFAVMALSGCYTAPETEVPELTAGEDEFLIAVHLDTADDVYRLSHEYALDGVPVGGGAYMDGRLEPIGYDVYLHFQRDILLAKGEDTDGFSVMFFISHTPEMSEDMNQAASHTGEYAVENEIRFSPRYGETYSVTVSGSRNGYRAELATNFSLKV